MIFNIKIHTLKKKRAAFNWVVWICQSGFGMPVPYPSFSSKQKQLGIIHEATQESNNVNIRYTKYCVDWMKLTQRIWLRRKKTQACHFKLRSLQCRLEKPNNRYILKRFLSSSLPFGLLPLCFLDHLSLLYLLLFSSPLPPPPFFFITPSFSEWAALRLLGFVEVYQKHVWRFGGGWWEVLRQAAHPHSSQRARASGEEKLLVSSKTESYWVFLQDIIFHWTDKQEKLPTLKYSL